MNGNDMIIKELVAMTKEIKASNEKLKATNERHDSTHKEYEATHKEHSAMLQELKANTAEQRVINKSLTAILQGHAEEMRDMKTDRRAILKVINDHDKFLREHHKSLLDIKDKLR